MPSGTELLVEKRTPPPHTPEPLSLSRAFARLLDALLTRIAALLPFLSLNSASATRDVDVIDDKDTGAAATSLTPRTIYTIEDMTTPTATLTSTTMGSDTVASAPVPAAGRTSTKTVVVLGCAYGGARAAQILAAGLPPGWRLVVLERNSHANHVYVMPRFAVLPGHEYKAFIPYTNVFLQNRDQDADGAASTAQEAPEAQTQEETERYTVLHAQVTALRANSVTYRPLSRSPSPTNDNNGCEEAEETLAFDYAIYALGAHMPPPLDLWGSASAPPLGAGGDTGAGAGVEGGHGVPYTGLKTQGCAFLVGKQGEIARVAGGNKDGRDGAGGGSVLVVGGGALGIQFATDIKAVYPTAAVTLLHSRERLLPRFGEGMHEEILRSCDALGVDVILGERLDLGSLSASTETEGVAKSQKGEGEARMQRVVRTVTGREIVVDLVLMCTGQTPNTAVLAGLDGALVEPRTRHARVHRTMQVSDGTVYDEDAGEKKEDKGMKGAEEALGNLALADAADAKNTEDPNDAKDMSAYPYPHIFAIGDAAAAFGAIPAGHTAFAQGEVAARNVLRLIKRAEVKGSEEEDEPLEEYTPGAPAIKVSLGLERAVYQVGPNIGVKTDGVPDLQAAVIWPYFGIKVEKDEDMRA